MVDPRARQFQMRLGPEPGRLEGLEELEQSLRIALGTPLGSVPGRPAFGTRLHELADEPVHEVRRVAIIEVQRGARAEPRVELLGVQVPGHTEDGHVVVEIHWRPSAESGLRADARVSEVLL
jgi:phage baseplate assembly protein W